MSQFQLTALITFDGTGLQIRVLMGDRFESTFSNIFMHRTIAPPTKLFDQGLGQTLWLKGSKIRDLGFHVQVDRGFG